MVFKRVDIQEAEENIEGFSYKNFDGNIEQVLLINGDEFVEISSQGGPDYFTVYTNDIPKLILALQAAYDHVKGKK